MSGEYIGKSQNGCLPNITGVYNRHSGYGNIVSDNTSSGAFYFDTSTAWSGKSVHPSDSNYSVNNVKFDASRSNSIYGSGWFSGTKVIPAGTGVSYIIKY